MLRRLLRKRDARGITVEYVYDALNRLTNVNFPDSDENVTYSYDEGTNGKGKRTGMADETGAVVFQYDDRGRLETKISTISGESYTLSRSFTPGSRVESMTYPSGRTVDYQRNECVCNISGVTTTFNSKTTTLMGGISYRAFGTASRVNSFVSSSIENIHDSTGRLRTSNPDAQTETSYDYDENGNLTSVLATNNLYANRAYSYDALNRLRYAQGGGDYGAYEYTYDNVGNRLTKKYNGVTETYSYISGTNRIDQITGENVIYYDYDENGNTVQINNRELIYNQSNRLSRVEENGDVLGEYTYNGMGQRIIKTAYGFAKTIFHYDFDGNIIAESEPSGKFAKEYLYMGDVRLAMVDVLDESVYMFISDNLGSTKSLTDKDGNEVWKASYKPFGEVLINPNISVVNNFRFAGQYYDSETGFHYNYHRYYDPSTGRYLRSDPIGQNGGINIYAYVDNNPVNENDPFGLATVYVWKPGTYIDSKGKKYDSSYGHASILSDSGKYLSHHPIKVGLGMNKLRSRFRTLCEDESLYGRKADFQYYIKLPNEGRLDNYIDNYKVGTAFWSVYKNCVDAVTGGLNKGGYNAPDSSDGFFDFTSYPEELIDHLKGIKNKNNSIIRDVTVTIP